MDEIELLVGDKKIKIVVKQNGWSDIYFIKDNTNVKLGANGISKIISKLVTAFDTSLDRKYVHYKGIKIFTIFCLMEPHATIAGRSVNDSELELLCIEDNGNVLPLVTLSEGDMKRWLYQLNDLINRDSEV